MFAGLAIYNALVDLNGNVTVGVDGLAASVACSIAMSGDKVIYGRLQLIAVCPVYAAGTVGDMEKTKDVSE